MALAAAALLSSATPGRSDGHCAAVEAISGGGPVAERAGGAEWCRESLTLGGGRAVHCAWRFDYRDPAAASWFDRLDGCLAGRESLAGGKPVNHPDTHRLSRYRVDGAEISVSLKDKAALGRTYVLVGAVQAAE